MTEAESPQFVPKQIYRVHIQAPIESVWSELLKTASPRPFLWNGSWDTDGFQPGTPYRVVANGGKSVAVIGRVLEIDPPHKLVTTFRLTSLPDPPSKVTYLLKEKDGGTEFSLITENVIAGSKSEKSMAQGAQFIVNNLKSYVDSGKVTFSARLMLAMFALMAPLTPRSMSADKWPRDEAE